MLSDICVGDTALEMHDLNGVTPNEQDATRQSVGKPRRLPRHTIARR